ncbi:AAA family ATPase [Paraburkholderia phymatum]|uniref:ATPase associated with various cellular activities AAA_5 n=1 Tax=Paraburkholderia phymatum (strain DSM 17167 / CIP 108236 / LMG 21445 / STM815) TaxID=391038 RepID=B2JTP0_PARP8|nr:AAA family ATPase [Paraburkholderia phymatum]ACC75943.1 ATPase associated with various cellular activities AAA_5 [Paraburkholderia phymatum STM815]
MRRDTSLGLELFSEPVDHVFSVVELVYALGVLDCMPHESDPQKMTNILTNEQLLDIWKSGFKTYRDEPWAIQWRQRYAEQVRMAKDAPRDAWMKAAFQESLWDDNPVANIGPGKSVTVTGAFSDTELAADLFNARDSMPEGDVQVRSKWLEQLYTKVLKRVADKKHATRRPKARLIRLLAAVFPEDMTCLMDERRLWQVLRLLGLHRLPGNFVAQHTLIRKHLRDVLGATATVEESVDQAILPWYLWETYIKSPDEGGSEQPNMGEADDIPEISFLPVDAQRRSLTCVSDNVGLLVAIVRETEHGLSREDLISLIMQEAPQLKSGSAVNIISQAQGGLGLITLTDGGYRPTSRGLDLLVAPDPIDVLRGPLIGRVFGMGHLLNWLSREPEGMTPAVLTAKLQALVPTWTSRQPAAYLIAWAKMVELVHPKESEAGSRLVLTDEGADYVAALPKDFEKRWQIRGSAVEALADIIAVPQAVDSSSAGVSAMYTVESIIEDGCFIPQEELSAMLRLLKNKSNLILQGPPGTGKTWLAKRLGYALLNRKDYSRLVSVQFQPSLSYEDFVRGWRPGADGRLDLIDGVFLEAIAQAQRSPEPYVVVIEEINRGNPAQVFGELLTLLEHDKRKEEEALRPAYVRSPEERIYIPKNLYVIGTMNVADRSLALIDLALRRRFAFATLTPALGSQWRDWCMTHGGFSNDDANDISMRIQRLNERITKDRSLGEQFRIGHSFVTPAQEAKIDNARAWFAEVVKSEIEPLLREYWFDDPDKVEEARKELVANL